MAQPSPPITPPLDLWTFMGQVKQDMLSELRWLVSDCQAHLRDMQALVPKDTDIDLGLNIDIRLCIDLDGTYSTWCFRTGPSDYDQRHSYYCSASCVTLDTDPVELLEELIQGMP